MNWNDMKKLEKFSEMNFVFKKIGQPKFKIEDRPLYYMGNGLVISYTDRKFKVENSNRIEFGKEGEYLLSLYYFKFNDDLKLFLRDNDKYSFGDTDLNFEIIPQISFDMEYKKVLKILENHKEKSFLNCGENRKFIKGKFEFSNLFIKFNNFEFFFFKNSKLANLSAFEYIFE